MRGGELRHRVRLETPTRTADGDGGYTETWEALTPSPVWAAVQPLTAADSERHVGNAVEAKVTHLVTIRFHEQVNTQTRVLFGDRILSVRGVQNVDELGVTLHLSCVEFVA